MPRKASDRFSQQGIESGLAEVLVRGEGISDIQVVHQAEAHAISEGPFFGVIIRRHKGYGLFPCARVLPFGLGVARRPSFCPVVSTFWPKRRESSPA